MDAYVRLLIKTCHKRGVHAMGGMAAQIPIKGDAAANDAALAKVRGLPGAARHAGARVIRGAAFPASRQPRSQLVDYAKPRPAALGPPGARRQAARGAGRPRRHLGRAPRAGQGAAARAVKPRSNSVTPAGSLLPLASQAQARNDACLTKSPPPRLQPTHPPSPQIAKAIFDEHMPQPNQLFVSRDDVRVGAADLLSTRGLAASFRESDIRLNIDIALRYMESWLRWGVGWGWGVGVGVTSSAALLLEPSTAAVLAPSLHPLIDCLPPPPASPNATPQGRRLRAHPQSDGGRRDRRDLPQPALAVGAPRGDDGRGQARDGGVGGGAAQRRDREVPAVRGGKLAAAAAGGPRPLQTSSATPRRRLPAPCPSPSAARPWSALFVPPHPCRPPPPHPTPHTPTPHPPPPTPQGDGRRQVQRLQV
jgi:hypothetical protein